MDAFVLCLDVYTPSHVWIWRRNVSVQDPNISRPWPKIAAEAMKEKDPKRMLELVQELNNALDSQPVEQEPGLAQVPNSTGAKAS